MSEAWLTRPGVARAAVFVVVLLTIVSCAACSTEDDTLAAALKTVCRASEDAVRADHRAELEFEDAAAASKQGGWDQSMALVDERLSRRVGERERQRRLSAELLDASRNRTDTAVAVLRTSRDIAEMYTEALRSGDEASMSALDRCKADVDQYAK